MFCGCCPDQTGLEGMTIRARARAGLPSSWMNVPFFEARKRGVQKRRTLTPAFWGRRAGCSLESQKMHSLHIQCKIELCQIHQMRSINLNMHSRHFQRKKCRKLLPKPPMHRYRQIHRFQSQGPCHHLHCPRNWRQDH